MIKLVEDADRGVLVGATSAGPMGGEVLYGLVMAVQAEVPVDRLRPPLRRAPNFAGRCAAQARIASLTSASPQLV